MENTTIATIMNRSSYRGEFSPEKVSRADLEMIMAAGLNAPSGCNMQTVSLIGVDQEELVAKIKATIDPPVAKSAPAFICVLSEKIFAYRNKCFAIQDYSAAIENMLLAIVALGYQSCWYEGHISTMTGSMTGLPKSSMSRQAMNLSVSCLWARLASRSGRPRKGVLKAGLVSMALTWRQARQTSKNDRHDAPMIVGLSFYYCPH